MKSNIEPGFSQRLFSVTGAGAQVLLFGQDLNYLLERYICKTQKLATTEFCIQKTGNYPNGYMLYMVVIRKEGSLLPSKAGLNLLVRELA